MSEQATIRTEFAALLSEQLGIPVAAFVPGTLRTPSGYLQDGAPYMDFAGDGAAFKRPALRLKLVLVSPAADWERAMSWIDDKVEALRSIPRTPVGGHVRPMITTVASLGVLDTKSLGFEVSFAPLQLGAP